MPGGIWGFFSPKLRLWAGADGVKLYAPSGDAADVDINGCYRRCEITEPRKFSKSLASAYKQHSHRSYGVAPFVNAYVPPGTTPAGLFVWDAVLRTSGASDWVIQDSGLVYLEALNRPHAEDLRMEACVFLFKTCIAWQVVRKGRDAHEIVTCGSVRNGTEDTAAVNALPSLLEQNAKEAIAETARSMVEDEVALLAEAPVTVFVEDGRVETSALAQSCAAALKTVLGGGGSVRVEPMPSPVQAMK